ncbi:MULTISPECIES: folate-binding protein YgfZ [Halomonadaceae]|uniref:CAF17-like 4Fe-4S cluster assembly/insertion protein YgfZ n=1 Tax=Halomonadaceae TaxID=28256 RepID=UPI00159865AF|nr:MULTISPECIES: folate-binding protein YgfZ [Halomonas]QJQ96683.1 folate-binding protein YgfZ [Halomonas sp. PA5]
MTDWSARLGAMTRDEGGSSQRVDFPTENQARQALDTTVISPLVHLGILEVAGGDAERFLQGQTSAQVSLADTRFAPLTAFCTPKGRMLANAQLLRVDEQRFWLVMAADRIVPLKTHLDKFAVFYKIEMQPRDDLALLGMIGQESRALLEARLDIVPPAIWHQAKQHPILALAHPGTRPRLMIIAPVDEVERVWQALTPQATPVSNAIWGLHDIQAGIAWVTQQTQDAYLPQMFNWEALGGISFKKGCYTGQEVVARAHFRGQVKKRLMRAQLEGAELPPTSTPIVDAEGKSYGETIAAELDAYGQAEILAVMSTKEITEPLAVLGQRYKCLKLPYPLERLDPEQLANS